MDRVWVAVHAGDPITLAGAISCLRARAELQVVPERRLSEAQVFVVCADAVNADVMGLLRRTAESTPVKIVLVTDRFHDADLLAAVECGVVAVLPKAAASGERLVHAVLAAKRGMGDMPPTLLGSLLAQVERLHKEVLRPNGLTASGLAPREIDVLRLMAEGWDTAQIATKLSYSERTVKNVVYAVMSRLGLRNRPHAVAYAMRSGVI
jgi:DNA-binding NarL/FixJ family response regulator